MPQRDDDDETSDGRQLSDVVWPGTGMFGPDGGWPGPRVTVEPAPNEDHGRVRTVIRTLPSG